MNLNLLACPAVLLSLTITQRGAWAQRRVSPDFARYSFEDRDVPAGWTVSDGDRLAVSSRHYKDGRQSLRWDWHSASKLTVTEPEGLRAAGETRGGGIMAWVYCEQAIDGHLTFRFGSADELRDDNPHYAFRFGLNFAGWRAMWVLFREDAANESHRGNGPLAIMEIVAPGTPEAGTAFFDLMAFPEQVPWFRAGDSQAPFVNAGRQEAWQGTYYWSQKKPVDPAPPNITEEEVEAFALIAERYEKWVFGDGLDHSREPIRTRHKALQHYIDLGKAAFERLNIAADGDIITGTPLFASRSPHRPKFIDVLQNSMIPLALDYRLNGNRASRDKIILLLDYIHDQGWAEGSGLGTLDHESLRSAGYMHAVYLMRNELKATGRLDRELATIEWYLDFGEIYERPQHPGTNADRMRTSLLHMLLRVLCMEDGPEKVRTMKNLVRWLNSACAIAPGWAGTIKPDYTGFHHRGIYANAYAPHGFHNAALVFSLLHDTPFALSQETRNNLRNALLTARVMTNKYDVPVGISGRMPFAPGVLNRILPGFAYMALSGEPCDQEMAAAFMRLWDPTSEAIRDDLIPKCRAGIMYLDTLGSLQMMTQLADMGIPAEASPVGHWTKPYGALTIHRRDDWMVSVKGWSKYVWNYEGHADQNVFGRYVSYGAMQIIARGNPVTDRESGYVHEGWDWSRWPGATTINLPLSTLGEEPKAKARFFTDESFVGGVSLEGRNGIFAMKLHDTVHDESFRALKTVFCFDDTLICLGSGIQNDDPEHPTETTLFQCHLPTRETPIWAHSPEAVQAFPYSKEFADEQPVWLMDSVGNGYYIPDASGLKITRRHQTSMHERGRGETAGDFATAWIDHGTAPHHASYEYAVLVQSDLEAVARFAESPAYEVLRKDEGAHIVRHRDTGITGYVLFQANSELGDGALKSVDTPCLIMMRETDNAIALGLSDPDLRLVDERIPDMGGIKGDTVYSESVPATTRVTLAGQWRLTAPHENARVVEATSIETTLEFDCKDGKSIEVSLHGAT